MSGRFVLVESNTTGTGRHFAAAARRRGHEPLLVATSPGRYPWAAGEGVATVGAATDDADDVVRAVLAASGGAPPAGVTSSSEYFVGVAAEVARRFGSPGPDPVATQRCRDKEIQRAALRAAGVAVPRMHPAASEEAAVAAAAELGYPVVCKPVDGTGSRGVRLCPDEAAVRAHARALLARPHGERGQPQPAPASISAPILRDTGRSVPRSQPDARPRFLVEEFVGGPEVSVETFGGEAVVVVDKHVGPLPSFVEYGHDVPSTLGPAETAAVQQLAVEAVGALGLGWGPAHTEIRLAPAGPVVIEVNPRLAGGMIPVLVELASDRDLVQSTVDLALGLSAPGAVPPTDGPHRGAAIRFVVVPNSARVGTAGDQAAARAVPGVVDVSLTAAPGDVVGGTGSFLDRIGWAIATGPTAQAAGEAAAAAARLLRPELVAFAPNHALVGAS